MFADFLAQFHRKMIVAWCIKTGCPSELITRAFDFSNDEIERIAQKHDDILYLGENPYFWNAFNMLPGSGKLPLMENIVYSWYNDYAKRNAPCIYAAYDDIQKTAMRVHELVYEKPIQFVADDKWFEEFRIRFGIRNPYVELLIKQADLVSSMLEKEPLRSIQEEVRAADVPMIVKEVPARPTPNASNENGVSVGRKAAAKRKITPKRRMLVSFECE